MTGWGGLLVTDRSHFTLYGPVTTGPKPPPNWLIRKGPTGRFVTDLTSTGHRPPPNRLIRKGPTGRFVKDLTSTGRLERDQPVDLSFGAVDFAEYVKYYSHNI